jgi:hypothetical protein
LQQAMEGAAHRVIIIDNHDEFGFVLNDHGRNLLVSPKGAQSHLGIMSSKHTPMREPAPIVRSLRKRRIKQANRELPN